MSLFQPIGQKRLTNVALVRYKKHGKRFEIAAYKNKVLNWRNGIEKDLDEVLQSTTVFSNVSKGVLAKREDLLLVFGTDNEEAICLKILAEGELQVSEKERKVELDTLFRDVASVLSEKCVNPETSRPYTISMLERALKDVHFNLDPNHPAKAQALEALPMLQARFPIERARMRLRVLVPVTSKDELHELLASRGGTLEEQDLTGSMLSVTCLVDPGAFRPLHTFLQGAGGGGRLEVVSLAATADDLADPSSRLNAAHDAVGGSGVRPFSASSADAGEGGTGAVLVAPAPAAGPVLSSSGFTAAAPVPRHVRRLPEGQAAATSNEQVVYARGPVGGLPEEHASRKERFAELETLQEGWTVELRSHSDGGSVEAVFYSPAGARVGTFAAARRAAMQAKKQLAAA